MARVVIVVDMQKGFLEPGRTLYCGDEARRIIPQVQRLIEAEKRKGSVILFTQDTHTPDDAEFQMFPPHCIKGTEEHDIIPELQPYAENRVEKNRYSAFFNTDLAGRLQALNPEAIVLCGVCTDICVLHTAADARNRDYTVEVPQDCVASFDPEAHRWALQHMAKILGVRLTTSEALVGA